MKGVSLPFIGLIGTFTIIAGILIPPAIIRTTISKETLFTYEHEKVQHALLMLFYSKQNGKSSYEILGQKALFENIACRTDGDCPTGYTCHRDKCTGPTTEQLKENLDIVMGVSSKNVTFKDYCISADETQVEQPQSRNEILQKYCPSTDIQFSTFVVLPYNKNPVTNEESFTKVLRIGIK